MRKLDPAVIDTAIQILRDGGVTLNERTFPYSCYALRVAQGLPTHETNEAPWSEDLYIVPFVKFSADRFGREVCNVDLWRFKGNYTGGPTNTPEWWSDHRIPAVQERINHLLDFRATLVDGELE